MVAHRRSLLRAVLCRWPYWLAVVAGLALVGVASFGVSLGVDPDSKWGEVRIITLVAGLALIGFAASDGLLNRIDRRLRELRQPESEAGAEPIIAARPSAVRRGLLALFFVSTVFVYLGLVTVWNWPRWPESTYIYDSLATAFSHGQVALLARPPVALTWLLNPYDPVQRRSIRVAGDLAYYNGRYYMYWGPTPAALIAPWRLAGGRPVSDARIVFASVAVMFIFSAMTVLHLKREYFSGLPPWLVFGGLILVATAHPVMWTLNSPTIYTAAIASGQAFFICGLYFMLTSLKSPQTVPWRELACGASWALAIGCRLTLLVAVAPLVLVMIGLRLRRSLGKQALRPQLLRMAWLLLPLAIGIASLGAYNVARFNDPFETGFRYQMVGADQGETIRQGLVFNIRYLLPNLLDYLTPPIRLIPRFPFIRPWYEPYPPFEVFLSRLHLPKEYSVQNEAGLIFVTPALLLGALLLMRAVSCPSDAEPDPLDARSRSDGRMTLRQIVWILLMAGIAVAGPTFLYKVTAQRFLMEVTPVFAILSAVGGFTLYQASLHQPARRTVVIVLIVATIVLSAVIGFLLALNGAASRFDDLNPDLYYFLVDFFSP